MINNNAVFHHEHDDKFIHNTLIEACIFPPCQESNEWNEPEQKSIKQHNTPYIQSHLKRDWFSWIKESWNLPHTNNSRLYVNIFFARNQLSNVVELGLNIQLLVIHRCFNDDLQLFVFI
jgi:hypothetical protein